MDVPTTDTEPRSAAPGRVPWHWLPLVAIAVVLAAAWAMGLHRYISFTELARHREDLLGWVASHGWTAPIVFMVTYAVTVLLSLPVIGVLTVVGGFFFGIVPGAIWSVIGATVGAAALHAATYTALGSWVARRADSSHMVGQAIEKMRAGFQRDAFSYIIFLRLVPVFPGFVINLVPALMGVPLGTYVVASVIGFIPMFLVLAGIGGGIGGILARGATPDLTIVFEPQILLPMLAMGLLSLAPVGYRWLMARKG
jgi:uncharacterized membrane protein YdjX (TVP38/TMEM64 family)